MGATYVDVTVRNLADPERSWTGKYPVDTGSFDSLVPRAHPEEVDPRNEELKRLARVLLK